MSFLSDGTLGAAEETGNRFSQNIFDSSLLSQGALVSSFVQDNSSPVKSTFFSLPVFLGEVNQNSTSPARKIQSTSEATHVKNSVPADAKDSSWVTGDLLVPLIRHEDFPATSECSRAVFDEDPPAPLSMHYDVVPVTSHALHSELDSLRSPGTTPLRPPREAEPPAERSARLSRVSSVVSLSLSSLKALVLDGLGVPDSAPSPPPSLSPAPPPPPLREPVRCGGGALDSAPEPLPMPFFIELSLSSSARCSRCRRGASIHAVVGSPANLTIRSDAGGIGEGDGWSGSASFAAASTRRKANAETGGMGGSEAAASMVNFTFKLPTFGQGSNGHRGGGAEEWKTERAPCAIRE